MGIPRVRRGPRLRRFMLVHLVLLAMIAAACGAGEEDAAAPAPDEPATENGAPEPEETDAGEPEPEEDEEEPPAPVEPVELKVGRSGNMWLEATFQLFAEDFGWYEEAGLDIEWVEGATTGVMSQLFATGELDLCFCGFPPSVELIGTSGDGQIVMVPNKSYLYQIVTNTEIQSIEDLEGRRIGTSGPGGSSEVNFLATMNAAGGDISTLDIVAIGGSHDQAVALVNEQIDASLQIQYIIAGLLEENPHLHVLVPTIYDYYETDRASTVYVASNLALENKADAVTAYIRETIRAMRWIMDNTEEAAEMAIERDYVFGDIADEHVREGYESAAAIPIWEPNGELPQEVYDATMEELAEFAPDLFTEEWSYDQIVDMSFVEAALEELGRR